MEILTSKAVKQKIEGSGTDTLWTYADFGSLPRKAVAAALYRLTKEGLIIRVRKGVYYKPRITRFGTTRPSTARIVEAVLKSRGIKWRPSGLPVYNALGLTTQLSAVSSYDVDRKITSLRQKSSRVRIRVMDNVRKTSAEERAVLDALRDIKSIPDTSPEEIFKAILHLCRSGRVSFDRVTKFAREEPPRVRALLGAIGTTLGKSSKELKALRSSLNPTTTFKLGLSTSIPAAREWGIR
jgi:hypothetical protein